MALELHSLFAKPIDRAIDGVIKADDEASLRLELEEYVITNEVATKLGRFLDAYNQYTNANGVWISGFFGCGKSHLLKMLALLLGHRDIEGRPAIDYFADKLTDDALLLGNLRRAVAIPAQSILFNIDQKADLVSKQDFDALLSVFQKVFDEMQGYYGKQAYIAQFERDLDAEGHFQPFRDAYARLAGQPWEQGRALVHLMKQRQAIAAAYAEVSGGSAEEARDILKRYREDYRSSIEDFALRVKDYIAARDREQPGFRLNFFVDEVGQYIAENVKLMTNLQTIAETLNTQCQGRAWLVVTAQQDMDAVIGDMERQQSNDFSKIMARFANRLPLNSADVAEVIQRRLLAKTDTAAASIGELYDDHAENLRTLFEFGDGTQRMKNFRDRAHFIRSYPFIPYQYELFQKAIRNLSDHNAFEGKHSSTGERSMLSVFHEVGKQMRHARLGEVATFDQMFEGIRTALKTNVQESILTAERQLDNPFALRVLKALFLVKYVDEFKSTARNIDILMRARLDLELKPHKARVEEALALLVQESYAQRHGECYEFLTDEEKDVEQRIKNIEIDTEQLNAEIQVLCFDDLISARKLKHHDSGQVFPISRRIDDHLYGRDHSLGIHLITPLRDAAERQDTALFMRSQGADDLFVVLPEDDRFFEDLLMYLRTERYVRQERGAEQRESIERIIREKGEQNASRRRHLLDQARQLLADARLIVRGEELDLRASDAKARIEQGFQTLVDRVHTSLAMLRGLSYSEADLPRHLAFTDDGTLTEAETEVLNKLKANARTGLRSTLKPLVAHFAAPPYGWDEAATLCQIAGLIGRGKLDARDGNGPLEGEALCKALPNTSAQAAITLQLQEEFSAAQVRRLRTLFEDLFDAKPQSSDGRGLGRETAEAINALWSEVQALRAQAERYPFVSALEPLSALLEPLRGRSAGWYLTELSQQSDAIADAREDHYSPIKRFLDGPQRAIYDDARDYLARQRPNLHQVDPALVTPIETTLADPACFKGQAMQQLKTQLDALKTEIREQLAAERARAEQEILHMRAQLEGLPEYAAQSDSLRAEIDSAARAAIKRLAHEDHLAVIRDTLHNFRDHTYPELLARLTAPLVSEQPPATEGNPQPHSAPATQPAKPPQQLVPLRNLSVPFGQPLLRTPEDVDAYLSALRQRLLDTLEAGQGISL